jgi:ABC-type transport system involved in multi-copper enzyme maturation permease subunit
MRGLLTVLHLTLHEAMRRRVLVAALIGGAAFLVLFGVGFHFIDRDLQRHATSLIERRLMLNLFVLAGLFAVNFLSVMTAVMLPVDTLSGEIASGVMQTLASKPVRRAEIVLGKWAAYVGLVAGYLAVMAGGVLLVARVLGRLTPPHIAQGLPLMALECALLVTLSIAGGTRFSTVTNGVSVLGLYGFAFIGNWVEQIGALAGNGTARSIGTIASLLMPSESMWQLAASRMQPPLMSELHLSPFSPVSVPSPAMVVWTAGYGVVVLLVALAQFRKRAL